MPERHTVDFTRFSLAILSDAAKGTIALQFVGEDGGEVGSYVIRALRRRYGDGMMSRLNRWRKGESDPLTFPSHGGPHPEDPEVLRYEMVVKPGEKMDPALAALIEFLRQQTGYIRTIGARLDLD